MTKVMLIVLVAVGILCGAALYVMHQNVTSVVNTEMRNPLQPGGEEQPDLSAAKESGASGGLENTATFTCDAGKQMTVVFTNNLAGVTLSDGRTMTLHQAISAAPGRTDAQADSAMRYLSNDEKVELHGTGKDGSLTENGVITYAHCTAP